MSDDGVNRTGLDYRAGWVEACNAILQALQVESIRARKGALTGLDIARGHALAHRKVVIDLMRGGPPADPPAVSDR